MTVLVAALAALLVFVAPARARAQADERVEITVVEVSGLLDRIQAEFLREQVTADEPADLIVVRLDSSGSVLSDDELDGLLDDVRHAPMPVAVWIGPGKDADAAGDTSQLLAAADHFERASTVPTLGDFIVSLPDVPTEVADEDADTPQRRLAPNVRVSFAEPSFTEQLLHAVSTPGAAYLLLVIGLLLLVFEFFTGGVGVAGAVAATCLALGAYGLGALPTRPLALAVLVVGVFGFAVDVQVGVPRAWTVIGTMLFTAGSVSLFAGGLRVPLLVLVAVLASVLLFMVAAMPAVVRTRFSTPTIGRQSMIGELGTATTDVAPEGLVNVREAPWRARTNRATPIKAGEPVRVAAIDGLLLEVEPLEGAARDAGH